jgi:DNA-binding protein HU-beta
VNRNELLAGMAKLSKLTKADCEKALKSFIEVVHHTVATGEDVRLIGHGTYTHVVRKATKARNPRTGDVINVAATTSPKFKAGKEFKDQVNKKKK